MLGLWLLALPRRQVWLWDLVRRAAVVALGRSIWLEELRRVGRRDIFAKASWSSGALGKTS